MVRRLLLPGILALACGPLALAQTALGTSFTYQGRLTDGAGPASGTYDLRFTLLDAVIGGSQVGPSVTRDDVTVTGGLFTVSLDFGTTFAGSKRWLQVEVRPGASTGTYAVLAPRQELTPTPNALFSVNASTVAGLSCANGEVAKWSGSTWACGTDADSGDITSVTAGTGLAGGGTSGAVTLAVDAKVVQSRVNEGCPAGSSIQTINQNGTVGCQPDTTGADWSRTGNAGTDPAVNFIGTTDSQPLEVRVNNLRTMRIEPNTGGSDRAPNLMLGYEGSSTAAGSQGAVVIGGGERGLNLYPNSVAANFATVSGGLDNQIDASGLDSVIAGGDGNRITGAQAVVSGGTVNTAFVAATVGGGAVNNATGSTSTVAGGSFNNATGDYSTVAGGTSNRSSGFASTVAGGSANLAGGALSFAAGHSARVRDPSQTGDANGDEGTFVWADSLATFFTSTGANQFLVRAAGGVAINTNTPSLGASLTVSGNTQMTGRLGFGSQTRQMLDLWGSGYGIGVQGSAHYSRSDYGFDWFRGGTHSDIQDDPGTGGFRQMRLDGDGNLHVRGTVSGGGADFAEMLAGESGLEPGDVLAIGTDGSLVKSSEPGQTTVVGVFSTQPGFLGGASDGEDHAGKVPLAVVGIVPVKATAENGPIRPGDRLIASATRGRAMRTSAEPVVGSVIGKALSPLASGTGVVQMLVLVQ